ncbi:para-nitrobenzyl esterase-like isoform X1 [Diabrotica undecimpunctata]|uniref:para-nitrobenzyl esterase-like isoform X1 n=1 Tax=Diabrotica undecimpunctata TaxID=50387 RepID=UPI003B631E25
MNLRLVIVCSLLYAGKNGAILSPENGAAAEQDELIVELENLGKLRGHILQSAEGKSYYAFQDIPYAEPPTGPNRFRPPKPHGAWEGVLDVTENKKTCAQVNDPNSVEDCLVLNVYTPVRASPDKSLPVFFWIHGGAFVVGNGSIFSFNPKFLIDYDIIIVTMNYRLGPFGFLTTLDENIPGNLGLKDQLLALKWTYDHIIRFGGDPKKITVGGESAGSMSAGFHLLSKAARGLITGIIQQSGSSLSSVFYPTNDRELAFEFGKSLNNSFTSTKSSDLLELLQQASYSDLMTLNNKFTSGRGVGFMDALTFKPVIENDNDDAFITEPMHDDVLEGHFNLVPILIGFNSEESLMFLEVTNKTLVEERANFLDERPANIVSPFLNVAEEDKEKVGTILKTFYSCSSFTEDRNALIKYTSDEVFVRSTIRQAEAASRYVPVYLYELTWLPDDSTLLGVPHGTELWYLWDGIKYGPINENFRKPVLKWWTNFIKYQNPTPGSDGELQNVIWPEVQPDAVKYLDINSQFTVKENPRHYYDIKNLLDLYTRPPYITY